MRLSMMIVLVATEIVSVCVDFGVQGSVGGFLYVTCVSVRFKVEFIFKIVVSFTSTGCYRKDNIQYSYLFQHNGE